MRGARQHKHTHQIMNEKNMDHSMKSWEENQFNNAGGRRRQSLLELNTGEQRVIVRGRGSMEGLQMRFSVLGSFQTLQFFLSNFQISKNQENVRRRSSKIIKKNLEAIGTQQLGANSFQVFTILSQFAGRDA